jgi:hypothetical protein
MPTNEPLLIYPRLWAKPRAVIAVLFVGFLTLVCVAPHAAPSEPQAEFITRAMLTVMWAFALCAVLGVRARTTFSASGIADFGTLRTVSIPWGLITNCTVVERTVRSPKSRPIHGVLIRFESQRTDPGNSIAKPQPRDRVIELFVPDAVPLAPGIVARLRTIPQLSQAPWELLEPSLRRHAAASDRKHP